MTIKTFDEKGEINDIRIDPSTGDIAFAEGKDAYAVIIADAVRTVEGELQYDVEYGIPYFSTVFASVGLRGVWRARVLDIIRKMPFVQTIGRMDMDYNPSNHTLYYTIELTTDEGEITISQ